MNADESPHELIVLAMSVLEVAFAETVENRHDYSKSALVEEIEQVSNILRHASKIHQELLDTSVGLAEQFHDMWMRIVAMLDQLEAYCAEIS
jgi:hypothetical protein